MEIERKYTIKKLPENLSSYPYHLIEQGYLCTKPVVRVRREDETYYLTYKGSGLMAREEYNLPLTDEAYQHLIAKADGTVITKKRYLIPLEPDTSHAVPLMIELDVFDAPFAPLIIAEVEFPSEAMSNAFVAPDWFLEDVTYDTAYHNSTLSRA
ncbi:MAG: CYTH domain-containing protein [Lachnospiraceae bacterium]